MGLWLIIESDKQLLLNMWLWQLEAANFTWLTTKETLIVTIFGDKEGR